MVATVTINPLATTTAIGSFSVASEGGVQGMYMADPAVRYALRGGFLLLTETLPMWGGVGIFEDIPSTTDTILDELQSPLGRATSISGGSFPLTGFSVFDQAHNMVTSPQSPVPLSASGMMVNYFRLGSGARINLAIDPSLVSLGGGLINQQVSWDFALQRLIPFAPAYNANVLTGLTWGTAGGGTVTGTTTTAHGLVATDDFTISGAVPAAYNGTFTALAGTTGSTLVFALPTNPGAATTLGTLVAGGGALPCKIDRLFIGNSMTVNFDPSTGFATWNRSGSVAEVMI